MIDALAFNTADLPKESVVVSRSQLTGNTWNGELLVFTDVETAPSRSKSAARVKTRSACAAVGWVGARQVVSGDDEGVLAVWEWKGDGTLERVSRCSEHDDMVASLDCDGLGGVLSASYDGSVKLWHLGGGAPSLQSTATFSGHTDTVYSARFQRGANASTASAAIVASSSLDGTVRVWDARKPYSSSAVVPLVGHGAATTVEWLGANRLAAGAVDGTMFVFDTRRLDAPIVPAQQMDGGAVRSLASRGAELLVGTDGGMVLRCTLADDGQLVVASAVAAHTDSVRAVGWRPSVPDTVVSGGWDGKITVTATE